MQESAVSPQDQTPTIWYALRNLVFDKRFEEAERLLAETPALVMMTDSVGETALHFLAVENDLEGVAWLHERGQAIDTCDAFGEPVIFAVAKLGYRDLFTWFAQAGVNLSAKDEYGKDLIPHLREWECDDMADWITAHFGANLCLGANADGLRE